MSDHQTLTYRDRIVWSVQFESPSRIASASKAQKLWSCVLGVKGEEKSFMLSEKQVAEVLAAIENAASMSIRKYLAKEKGNVR